MGIRVQKMEPHWSYLLAIEQDFVRLARFVDFDEKNFGCFSIEIARLLMAAAAETDVVCKQLCERLEPRSKASKIGAYKTVLLKHFPRLPSFVVTMPKHGLALKPWSNWNKKKDGEAPLWWTAYNKIKHHRHTDFHQGNLKNALNAMAGLFVMVIHLYEDRATEGLLAPSPALLSVSEENNGGTGLWNEQDHTIRYLLARRR
jgi:hypothetical protein